jgi:hypothetical protein
MSPAAAGAPPREDLLYWERSAGDGIVQSARLREWKAVRPKLGGPLELYNLAADIRERQNVAGKHADIAADLEGLMRLAHRPPRPQSSILQTTDAGTIKRVLERPQPGHSNRLHAERRDFDQHQEVLEWGICFSGRFTSMFPPGPS